MPPMTDNRLGSLVLNREGTNLARVDPLKQMFRSLFSLIHPSARGHVVAVVGEFLGTLIFVFLAFAGVEVAGASSNKDQGKGVSTAPPAASPSQLLYAAVAAGFSLAVTAWTFFRISGGLFNPVVRSLVLATFRVLTDIADFFRDGLDWRYHLGKMRTSLRRSNRCYYFCLVHGVRTFQWRTEYQHNTWRWSQPCTRCRN